MDSISLSPNATCGASFLPCHESHEAKVSVGDCVQVKSWWPDLSWCVCSLSGKEVFLPKKVFHQAPNLLSAKEPPFYIWPQDSLVELVEMEYHIVNRAVEGVKALVAFYAPNLSFENSRLLGESLHLLCASPAEILDGLLQSAKLGQDVRRYTNPLVKFIDSKCASWQHWSSIAEMRLQYLRTIHESNTIESYARLLPRLPSRRIKNYQSCLRVIQMENPNQTDIWENALSRCDRIFKLSHMYSSIEGLPLVVNPYEELHVDLAVRGRGGKSMRIWVLNYMLCLSASDNDAHLLCLPFVQCVLLEDDQFPFAVEMSYFETVYGLSFCSVEDRERFCAQFKSLHGESSEKWKRLRGRLQPLRECLEFLNVLCSSQVYHHVLLQAVIKNCHTCWYYLMVDELTSSSGTDEILQLVSELNQTLRSWVQTAKQSGIGKMFQVLESSRRRLWIMASITRLHDYANRLSHTLAWSVAPSFTYQGNDPQEWWNMSFGRVAKVQTGNFLNAMACTSLLEHQSSEARGKVLVRFRKVFAGDYVKQRHFLEYFHQRTFQEAFENIWKEDSVEQLGLKQQVESTVDGKEKAVAIVPELLRPLPKDSIAFVRNDAGKKILLGKGAFGAVRLAKWGEDFVAVKCTNSMSAQDRMDFEKEANVLQLLCHPNIVQFVGLSEDPFGVVLEYMDGGTLSAAIPKTNQSQKLHLLRQMCCGIAYLHEKKVAHLDLKPGNILLNKDYTVAKVADFGLARSLGASYFTAKTLASASTVAYTAPERGADTKTTSFFSFAALDSYSVGIIIWEVVSGRKPYTEGSNTQLSLLLNVTRGLRPDVNLLPEEFRSIISRCWESEPRNRPPVTLIELELKYLCELHSLPLEKETTSVPELFAGKGRIAPKEKVVKNNTSVIAPLMNLLAGLSSRYNQASRKRDLMYEWLEPRFKQYLKASLQDLMVGEKLNGNYIGSICTVEAGSTARGVDIGIADKDIILALNDEENHPVWYTINEGGAAVIRWKRDGETVPSRVIQLIAKAFYGTAAHVVQTQSQVSGFFFLKAVGTRGKVLTTWANEFGFEVDVLPAFVASDGSLLLLDTSTGLCTVNNARQSSLMLSSLESFYGHVLATVKLLKLVAKLEWNRDLPFQTWNSERRTRWKLPGSLLEAVIMTIVPSLEIEEWEDLTEVSKMRLCWTLLSEKLGECGVVSSPHTKENMISVFLQPDAADAKEALITWLSDIVGLDEEMLVERISSRLVEGTLRPAHIVGDAQEQKKVISELNALLQTLGVQGTQSPRVMVEVDIAFLFDCTGNMSKYLRALRENLPNMASQLEVHIPDVSLRFAFVGYRDVGDTIPLICFDFSDNVAALAEFIEMQAVSQGGGGDAAEDAFSGLKNVLQLDWSKNGSAIKQVIHVADAPGHGCRYHDFSDRTKEPHPWKTSQAKWDRFPDFDSNGEIGSALMQEMANKQIDFAFIHLSRYTEKMVRQLKHWYDSYSHTCGFRVLYLKSTPSDLVELVIHSIQETQSKKK